MTITDTWKDLRTCPRCGTKLLRVYRTRKFFCPKCHPDYINENHKLREAYCVKIAQRRILSEALDSKEKSGVQVPASQGR